MNKKIVLQILRKLFPAGTEKVTMNLVDKKMTSVIFGVTQVDDLDESKFGPNLSMLKDFLNIKGNVLEVDLDLVNKTAKVKHTEGIKMI